MLKRWDTQYFRERTAKLGIVLVGNGAIMLDGKTVSPAINTRKVTVNKAVVQGTAEGLPFKKGFTNMGSDTRNGCG